MNDTPNDDNDHEEHVHTDTAVPHTEEQETFEDSEQNSWKPSCEMASLPTEIFRKNILPLAVRKSILQTEPKNEAISFTLPDMDKKVWTQMSRFSRETDKELRKIAYRFSSTIRPIDNSLRYIYASKPDDSADQNVKDTWFQLEQTVLNSRALVLDSLSYVNDIRREQALKSVVPGYKKPSERVEVFGDDLADIIKKENETNKLFNDAAWQKTRRNTFSRTQNPTSINFKQPSKPSYNNYRTRNYNSRAQNTKNQYNGDNQPRQSSK
jgi:hypothetical protein